MPLDIGIGILTALGVSHLFDTTATPTLLIFSIACALLPDIDILTIPLLGKWHHRTHTHYPILYVFLSLIAFVFLSPIYATIFTICVFAHLVHDTFGIGWGIAWLWPLSPRKFLFFSAGGWTGKLFASWLPGEEPTFVATHDDPNWVRHYYLRLGTLAYIEYGILLLSLAILYLYYS